MVVLLPAPLGPRSARTEPRGMVKEVQASTVLSPYDMVSCEAWTAGASVICGMVLLLWRGCVR